MYTATITGLGQSDKWFWDTEPKTVIAMLDEKKKIDLENWRLMAHLNQGGQVETDAGELEGVDAPAGDIAWMFGG